jgi:hypothetical protein
MRLGSQEAVRLLSAMSYELSTASKHPGFLASKRV